MKKKQENILQKEREVLEAIITEANQAFDGSGIQAAITVAGLKEAMNAQASIVMDSYNRGEERFEIAKKRLNAKVEDLKRKIYFSIISILSITYIFVKSMFLPLCITDKSIFLLLYT